MNSVPRVILIFPAPLATIPPGITYVAKRFMKNGFEVKIHINTFQRFLNSAELLEYVIKPYQPDIVGLSFTTFNVLEVYKLQKLSREAGYFVISGGIHPSIKPEEVLKSGADMVFRGEAEFSIDRFCDWYKNGRKKEESVNMPGISYLAENGAIAHTSKPARIRDLDGLGETDFSLVNLEDFKVYDGSIKGLNMISCGRGCPFSCTYCSHSDWLEYSQRSADSIVQEMVHRYQLYKIDHFWLSDETFTIDKERVYKFCERLRREKLDFKWSTNTRISSVDKDLLKAMKDAGLSQITYGVESGDDETLKKIRKGHTVQQAYQIIELTGKLGIPVFINLMTGFPWETPRHVRSNINFIKAANRYTSGYSLHGAVIPYPDTALYEEYHEKEGFTDYWLKERYQYAGLAIYQNVVDVYKVTTYFQRNLFDDTYVAEDYFFKFTPEYKKTVVKMGLLIGWKTFRARYRSSWKRYFNFAVGYLSYVLYRVNPNIEKKIAGSLMKSNRVHATRLTGGRFVKR